MARDHEPGDLQLWPLDSEERVGHFKIFSLIDSTRISPVTGRKHRFVGLEASDWVNVIALTNDGRVLLVRQYRHGTDSITVEIPGGVVDPGEDAETAGARELEEETGYRPGEMVFLGRVEPNPAFLNNSCWTYLALDCTPDGDLQTDGSEELEVSSTSLDGFTDLINRGEIRHSLVIAAHDHLRRRLSLDPELAARLSSAL